MVECFRGPGFVLQFGDAGFAQFFADEFNVDIEADEFRDLGDSKGKRLRCFLQKADNALALQVIETLWVHRQYEMERIGRIEPSSGLQAKLELIKTRLKSDSGAGHAAIPVAYHESKFVEFRERLYGLRDVSPQRRGYQFENFLTDCFNVFDLSARGGFRNTGEQIDGSFVLDHEVYLLEAKWVAEPVGVADLRAFLGKLDKATWTRGVFVSYNGFSDAGLTAFGNAKSLVCVEGRDIYDAFEVRLPLNELLRLKVRAAAETGFPFQPVASLLKA